VDTVYTPSIKSKKCWESVLLLKVGHVLPTVV